eukprot:scaffold4588_cov112-Isochrysis_galbana.AAC.6
MHAISPLGLGTRTRRLELPLRKRYPPEIATWENRRGLPETMVDAYEAALEAEADLEAKEARARDCGRGGG